LILFFVFDKAGK